MSAYEAKIKATEGIIRYSGDNIQILMPDETNIPILVKSSHLVTPSLYVAVPGDKGLGTAVARLYLGPAPTPASTAMVKWTLSYGQALEEEAHNLRIEATMSGSAVGFHQAYSKYKQALKRIPGDVGRSLSKSISSAEKVSSIRMDLSDRTTLDLPEMHRHLSHSLSGMALCKLFGERSPHAFFNLTSSALVWERDNTLELVGFLRMNLLLMGQRNVELVPPAVLTAFNEKVVLPVVMATTDAVLMEIEKTIVNEETWKQAVATVEKKKRELGEYKKADDEKKSAELRKLVDTVFLGGFLSAKGLRNIVGSNPVDGMAKRSKK